MYGVIKLERNYDRKTRWEFSLAVKASVAVWVKGSVMRNSQSLESNVVTRIIFFKIIYKKLVHSSIALKSKYFILTHEKLLNNFWKKDNMHSLAIIHIAN